MGFICGTRCDAFVEETMSTHVPAGKTLAIHSVVVAPAWQRRGAATVGLRQYIAEVRAEASVEDVIGGADARASSRGTDPSPRRLTWEGTLDARRGDVVRGRSRVETGTSP